MLIAIRERAQGWLAWVIVIFISIPFALWGIQSYLGVGGEPVVATVNGVEIGERDLSRRVQQTRIELRERLGAGYDPALFEDGRLRAEVLDDIIRQTLLLETSNRIGMRVSDAELQLQILSEPAFQRDGRFDRETYERLLQIQGLSPARFEAQLRSQLIGNQLLRAVVGSELVTGVELSNYQRLVGQERDFAIIRLPVEEFLDTDPVDEAQILAYYESNAASFQRPEMVKLDMIVLDVADLAQDVSIDDEELRALYEEDLSQFGQREQRAVRHLLRSVAQTADEAVAEQALAELTAIRERILAGESFADLARTSSEDPASASEGGSLGTIEQGLMDPVFDLVAFSLPEGEVSQPIRTRFGYHLIEVTEIIPPATRSFDEVKEELRAQVSRQRAESLYYDLGERLANVAYESPDSLEPAADELGLTLRQTDWLDRNGGDDLLAQPRVIGAAFSDDVLIGRNNSDLIEPVPDVLRAVVLRVADHREASIRDLDEVREDIVAAIQSERARTAALAAGQELVDQLREGTARTDLSIPWEVELLEAIERMDPSIPGPIRELAFKLPVPDASQPSVGLAEFGTGDVAVVQLDAVRDGEMSPRDDPEVLAEANLLGQLIGRHSYEAMLSDIATRAKIERRPITTGAEL
ncbi:peptidylprolyl isomerase [Thiocapsa imhoffii]|uniref:Periplasmic chaperone PpiD n=1 Tax=Thiocapsa imhoffii TaxID=382777 RepID=A0A9X1BAG0_9GAMM|nr:SurA N-terminal domain-containing protein [Thiocapsa imhoffii]MBK1646248.1 peptidylprolyl isomerase [Thiocapsa imhoffii]